MSRTDADAEQERIPQPDPETDPYTESELRALRHGIASLKEIYREVIVLCGLEGKTYQEASEILGIPLGTVCSRMNSANHQLRIKLKRVRR